jgi:ADP-heptose:LPS heptosyltransferase
MAEIGAGAGVAGDTGVPHLATAFGKPSVTLFGVPDPGLMRNEPDEVIAALRRLR